MSSTNKHKRQLVDQTAILLSPLQFIADILYFQICIQDCQENQTKIKNQTRLTWKGKFDDNFNERREQKRM